MLADGIGHDFPKGVDPDDIREEKVGDGKGNQEENPMFQALLHVFGGGIRTVVQLFLLGPIAFDPKFNPAEYQLHEDGLRAGPPAPYAPINGGKQYDAYQRDQHAEHKDVEVLGPENIAEQDELALNDIEQEEWLATHLNKGGSEEKRQQRIPHHLPPVKPPALRLLRIYPFAFRFCAYCGCCHFCHRHSPAVTSGVPAIS